MWITGGWKSGSYYGNIRQNATWIINENNECKQGEDLPFPTSGHCIVQYNDTHSLMIGGNNYPTNPNGTGEAKWSINGAFMEHKWSLFGSIKNDNILTTFLIINLPHFSLSVK